MLHRQPDADHVHLQNSFEVVGFQQFHGPERPLRAGIGDQDVERAKAIDGRRDRCRRGGLVVRFGNGGCAILAAAKPGADFFQPCTIAVDQHHPGAQVDEQPGRGPADSACATGDDRGLSVKPLGIGRTARHGRSSLGFCQNATGSAALQGPNNMKKGGPEGPPL